MLKSKKSRCFLAAASISCASLYACGYSDNPNPPPLNNREGYVSRGPVTSPPSADIVEKGLGITPPYRNERLQPIPPARVDASATLKQVGSDVRISVKVLMAAPGKVHVAIDRQSCVDLAKIGSTAEKRSQAASGSIGVGDFTVSEEGTGALDTSLAGVALDPPGGDEALLGKSLVMYQAQGDPGAGGARELPIACTKIL